MLHLLQVFESPSKTRNALQHCKYCRKKSSETGCYTRTIFRATSYHCKSALQSTSVTPPLLSRIVLQLSSQTEVCQLSGSLDCTQSLSFLHSIGRLERVRGTAARRMGRKLFPLPFSAFSARPSTSLTPVSRAVVYLPRSSLSITKRKVRDCVQSNGPPDSGSVRFYVPESSRKLLWSNTGGRLNATVECYSGQTINCWAIELSQRHDDFIFELPFLKCRIDTARLAFRPSSAVI